MEYRFFALVVFFPVFVAAQPPKVPAKLDFADLKLRITEEARKEIQQDVDRLRRSPIYFDKQVEKAKSYFPIIERVFEEERLPSDFKYLVLQESGLVADAVSSSNAVGFWQFKDFTAAEVGLRVDKFIDERMNIEASSRGAARYLKKNNNSFFDNWLMSLQAYQMGPGAALKVGADKHRGAKSMTINKKTYWYVKKYLAHKIAYEGAIKGQGQVKLVEHRSTGNETLADIAKLYRVDAGEVTAYNKWLRKGKIPKDKTYTVIIPSENASMVALASMPDNSQTVEGGTTGDDTGSIDYHFQDASEFPKIKGEAGVQTGKVVGINGLRGIVAGKQDKIPALAAKGGIELAKFLKYNDLDINDTLVPGQVYYLRSKRSKAKTHYHIVQEGETLWGISQKYGVKLKKLRVKNRMDAQEQVKAGRVIWLRYIRPSKVPVEYRELEPKQPGPVVVQNPGTTDTTTQTAPTDTSNTVEDMEEAKNRPLTFLEKLDSLERLNNRKEDTVKSIVPPPTQAAGEQADPNMIPGSTGLPPTMEASQTSEDGPAEEVPMQPDSVLRIHVVSKGETYYSISKTYNVTVMDILKWNNLHINDKLGIGQQVKVYERPSKPQLPPEGSPLPPSSLEPNSYIIYTVIEGDTLYSIARSHRVSVKEIMEWNDKKDMGVTLGEKLKIQKAGNN